MSCEEYTGLDVDSKVEMIRALVPLGLMQVEELLDEEVKALAGSDTRERRRRCGVGVTGAIQGRWGLGPAGAGSGSPGSQRGSGEIPLRSTMNSVRVAR